MSDRHSSFQDAFRLGKQYFERGRYRESIEAFKAASQLVDPFTRRYGDSQLWLVTAYQASGSTAEAIALCQQLLNHPHSEIRSQSRNLLAILQAPQLKRPQAWMTQIPDLGTLSESGPEDRRTWHGSGSGREKSVVPEPEIDSSQVRTQDSPFVWIALAGLLLVTAGIVWLG
ncbi:hypothetical protein KR51_00003130 [Rubidibacter lacunae KORDI 51-2]|uniref:Tetratricopeptide repeat protein n=1 Tax=Rubidibacter lacunae KORDI 51-2 TaxID=582515 RepID=U5DQ77_9CHRO|nr:hypothetical protein [Rubidibacter lacunae]ERN43002.1 hypothetical protein KR51_00003130 [Rubidibacter lacunae KORDI 51-2]